MSLGIDLRVLRNRRVGHGVPPSQAHNAGSSSFPCPQCQGKTQVYDSRPNGDGIMRRRACTKCGHRVKTFEGEANLLPGAANRAILAVVKTLRALATELEQAAADPGELE